VGKELRYKEYSYSVEFQLEFSIRFEEALREITIQIRVHILDLHLKSKVTSAQHQ
jgi:hypothetical protein